MLIRRFAVSAALVAAALVVISPSPEAPATTAAAGSAVNAVGTPSSGLAPDGSVRGFVDAHNHLFSNEAFGGKLLCGKVFDQGGPEKALVDCPDHFPNGAGAWFENFTKNGSPFGTHDPAGYPSLKDWPSYNSLTHQQNYYAWIERAWRGGLRVMVNDLVTNRQLCDIYPLKDRPCDEMTSIRLQANLAFQLQAFIDNQAGGPGKGWYRIARSSTEARAAVAAGKLAVILGVETSEPFGCRQILGIAQCSQADIDRGLDELYGLGVRSMFVCHKFDNALCGVRFDSGTTGNIVNVGNFVGTGRFWQARTCTGKYHDNPISPAGVLPKEFADKLPVGVTLPLYPPTPHCNVHGLTALGEHMVRGMMSRGMMIELDHMSAAAASRTMDILEAARYPGVISSHSWTDPGFLERIYALGGMVTHYGTGSEQFVKDLKATKPLRDKYGIAGYGVGIDANGFGGLAPPRKGNVTYPFTSFDGAVTLDRLRTGNRTWDVNVDGMPHYGLLPDYIEDMRKIGGDEVVADMAGGAEAYLRTFGRTESYKPPANLAQGRPATASSYEWWTPWVPLGPASAVDGNRGSRWASEWNDNQWLRVDLGANRDINRVVLEWQDAYAAQYRVEVSTDGTAWRTAATVTTGDGGIDVVPIATTTTRYVRIQGVRRGTQYGYSLWELGVNS